jgi:transposase
MRKIREALRLRASGLTTREVGDSIGVGRTSVSEYVGRAARAGLSWPLPDDLTDSALEALLFPAPPPDAATTYPKPDWPHVHSELRRPGVTLSLLCEEYREAHPKAYGYSRFCELYRRWEGRLAPVMRQHHVAGEALYVDYSGATFEIMDPKTGELRQAQFFVAALGASNLTYAEATWTQGLSDWIGSHVRAFAFFGGVPATVVSDNLKSGVTKACFHDPQINRSYADMAAHYDTAIIPARPRKPQDKAKVEVAVQLAQRWIHARLRDRRFTSLTELNAAIRELLERFNNRRTRHLGASRRELFEQIERHALQPLPLEPYEFAEWRCRKVGLDYHVEIDRHYYSVPHSLLKAQVWVRITDRTVEIFHEDQRVASHARTSSNRKHTTVMDHMPSNHRAYADWTPEHLCRWATKVGPNTEALVEVIMRERKHPVQGFRACLGILRLSKGYAATEFEAAAEYALTIGAHSYGSLQSILKNKRYRRAPDRPAEEPAITHPNIRGADYFH